MNDKAPPPHPAPERTCDHCGVTLDPGVQTCPACGSGLIHGSDSPHDVLSGSATATNVGKWAVGCLVVVVLIALLVWIFS